MTRATHSRWFDWAFLVAGLAAAVATRPSMWALVVAVVAGLLWSTVRRSVNWGQVLICLAVLGAVALFYLRGDPRHSAQPGVPAGVTYVEEDQIFHIRGDRMRTMAGRAVRNIPVVFNRILAKAAFGMPLGMPLAFLLNGTLVVAGVALVRTRPVWGMFVLATLLMVLLVPKPLERYFLPVLPLLVFAWWRLLRWVNHRLPPKWANPVFVGLFVLGVGPNVGQVGAFVREQRATPFLERYKAGRFASVYEAAEMVRRHTPPSGAAYDPDTTWVLTQPKFGRILTFLSGRYATEPDETTQLRPDRDDAWVHIYTLEPSEPAVRDPDDLRRPTVRAWLGARGFEVSPNVIAEVPNRDPDAAPPTWGLHRVRPILLGERIEIIERLWAREREREQRERAERENAEREKAGSSAATSPATSPAATTEAAPP